MEGVSVKAFYLLLYSIALRTLSHLLLKLYIARLFFKYSGGTYLIGYVLEQPANWRTVA